MKKGIIGFIAGVLCVLLLGGSFYLGTKFANKEDKKETKTEEKEETKEKENAKTELKSNDKLVVEASRLVPMKFCHGYAIKLNGKNRTIKDLTDNEKLAMTVSYFAADLDFNDVPDDEYDGEVHKELKASEVEKLFEDTSFLSTLKKSGSYSLGAESIYYEGGKYYVNIIATGCEEIEHKDDTLTFYKAEKEGDTLKVTYGYAYEVVAFDEKADDFVISLYKAKEDKKPLVKNPEVDEETYMYDVDWSKFNQYEFVYDISNDNIRLQEINFIKAK